MYILEGNIGAGKSTFLKMIGHHFPHISAGLEPLNNWHSEKNGQSLLQKFYDDPKRWAFMLETVAMISRVKEHMLDQQHKNPWRIVERSVYSGYYCFAQNSFNSGFLTDIEWDAYKDWFTFLTQYNCQAPHGFIYLKVDPAIAFERTKKRNRSAESSLTLEYMQDIDKLHNSFLIEKIETQNSLKDIPVLVLDCNTEFESDKAQFEQHCQSLTTFLFETAPSNREAGAHKKVADSYIP